MLKWMVTAARGREDGDEVSLAESHGADNDGDIFTITNNVDYGTLDITGSASHSSGYSSGHNNTLHKDQSEHDKRLET